MSKNKGSSSTRGPKYEAEDYLYSVVWSDDDNLGHIATITVWQSQDVIP
jgi:hypothetical protein